MCRSRWPIFWIKKKINFPWKLRVFFYQKTGKNLCIHLVDNERNDLTLEAEQVYIVTVQRLNREYRRDSIVERTSLLLSDSQFCTHINSIRSYTHSSSRKMRFARQLLTIRVINCDDRLRTVRNNAEKRKHDAMLPSIICAIVCGPSNCGKPTFS